MGERQRLARDLHDGAKSELVSLVIGLKQAEEHPDTSPALAGTLVALEDHAIAALESVREIAHGIYPQPLAKLGRVEAPRAQAMRAPTHMSISGTAPHSADEAEAVVYFACSEVLHNVAKHAGPCGARHCLAGLRPGDADGPGRSRRSRL
jgi:signal transduction histidine kinase